MAYRIEVADPYSPRRDEEFDCATVRELADRLDDLTGIGAEAALEMAGVVAGTGHAVWTDIETGRTVEGREVDES